ncbi:hypothetical protein Taro_030202 [Colocasia esculenta]|uniref:Uncharacterized protein n=1 Tax=Colocasia esculenta TaxID=4460 RepID=A0A843VZJ6_COLES|nr:hypothetical protein [Colocasia esculenta]
MIHKLIASARRRVLYLQDHRVTSVGECSDAQVRVGRMERQDCCIRSCLSRCERCLPLYSGSVSVVYVTRSTELAGLGRREPSILMPSALVSARSAETPPASVSQVTTRPTPEPSGRMTTLKQPVTLGTYVPKASFSPSSSVHKAADSVADAVTEIDQATVVGITKHPGITFPPDFELGGVGVPDHLVSHQSLGRGVPATCVGLSMKTRTNLSCKDSVDTTINGLDTMVQNKGRNVKKSSSSVDTSPGQVDTTSSQVDTRDLSQGIDLPVWDSVSTHLMGRSTHSGISVT